MSVLPAVGACAGAAPRPALVQRAAVLGASSVSTSTRTRERATLEEQVHGVLERHCAECHAGRRASAPPAALAVFDLDRPEWPERFDAGRFEVALARLSDKPEADQALFRAFRDARLAPR